MTKEKNPVLNDHFEKLKTLLPEVYAKHFKEERENKTQKLFRMLKGSLGVIEAVYLQNSDTFSMSKAEEYRKIIEELKTLGFSYEGHPELLRMAGDFMLMKAKKPMEKAGIKHAEADRKAM